MADIATHIKYAESPQDFGVPLLERVNSPVELEVALQRNRGKHGLISIENNQTDWNFHTYQDVSRSFATVSLGFLGDKDDVPMLSRIQENSNYLAQTGALAELLTIL